VNRLQSLRTHIALLATVLLSIAFFLYKFADGNLDAIIPVIVAAIFIAAFKDVRFLFAGWFLTAPYVVQIGGVGLPNIANNLGHNFLAPIITVISLTVFALQKKKIAFGKADLLILLFIAYAAFSSLIATGGSYDGFRPLYFCYALPFLLYLVAKNVQMDSRFFRMLGYVSVFHLVQMSLLCTVNIIIGKNLYPPELFWTDAGTFSRQIGSVGNPAIFGVLLQVIFSFLFLAYRYGLLAEWMIRVSLVPLVIMTIFTFTRSVWVAAFLTFVFLVYKTSAQAAGKLFRILALTVFSISLIFIVMAALPDVKGRFTEDQTANFRIVMAQASVNLIVHNPILGVGQGKFDEAVERYLFDARGVYNTRETSHVTLLTILAELGLVGGVLWVGFIVMNLRHPGVRMTELSKEDQFIVAIFISNVIAFLVNAFLIDMRWSLIGYSLLFTSLGFIQNILRENYLMKVQAA
jgi:O-antigen ligase